MKFIRKTFLLLFICFSFSSCNLLFNNNDKYEYFEVTVINYTDKFIDFSIVQEYVATDNPSIFNSSYHIYLKDYVGNSLKEVLLCPYGSTSENYELYKITYRISKGNYSGTIFVNTNNDYTTNPKVFIGKKYSTFSNNCTISINYNGTITVI